MTLLSGSLLVLLTWALALIAIAVLGFGLAGLGTARLQAETIRRGMWWGLTVGLTVILTSGLVTPLRGAPAAVTMVVAVLLGGTWAVLAVRRSGGITQLRASLNRPGAVGGALLVMMAAATIYLAVAALGPVTNYDTGLYHLGAVSYAGDFATIPGLANLYFPFGYNASLFPAAAFLGNGPWDGQGYRLANGLILILVMADLAIRLLSRRRTIGTHVLMVAVPVVLVPMVALSDYWVTSPTTDSAVFALTMVAVAYLSDALWSRRNLVQDGSVAFLIAVLLVSLRPLMAVFLLCIVGVLAVSAWRGRSGSHRPMPSYRATMAAAAVLALMLGAVQSVRDYLLSGWLQFPLSVVAFDVPWRAPDPVWNRTPTLGAARDSSDLWAAAEGYGWIPAWLGRLPSQWETYYLLVLLLAAALSWLLVRKSMARVRVLLLVMVPCAATVLVWFVATPPSFRFAWGVVFAIPVANMAWSLQAATVANRGSPAERALTPTIALGSVTAVLLVIGYSAVARLDVASMTQKIEWSAGPLRIPLAVTPITPSPVIEQVLESGLTVRIPTRSDQCWAQYPLCTAQLDGTVSLRGATLQDGFLPQAQPGLE